VSVGSSGKSVVGSCAVCHNPQMKIDSRIIDLGETITLRRGKTYNLALIDRPDEQRPVDDNRGSPHDDTARYWFWPSGPQTLAASADESLIVGSSAEQIDFVIRNDQNLLTKGSDWSPSVLGKSAQLEPGWVLEIDSDNNDGFELPQGDLEEYMSRHACPVKTH